METNRTSDSLLVPACCLTCSDSERLCSVRPGADMGLLFTEESCLVSFWGLASAQGPVHPLWIEGTGS